MMDAIEEEESSDDGQESTTPSCLHSTVDLASRCLTLAPAISARRLANADNPILRTQRIPSPITSVTLQVIATPLPVSPCLTLFETEEALRDHICISHKATLPVALETNFRQFEDGPLIMVRNISFEWPQPDSDLVTGAARPNLSTYSRTAFFADNISPSYYDSPTESRCQCVPSDHPVVVCWDCYSTVVDKNALESH